MSEAITDAAQFALDFEARYGAIEEQAVDNGVALPRVPWHLVIIDKSSAALVVGAMQDCKSMQAAIQAQADRMKAAVERYAACLHERHDNQLREFTGQALDGKKVRSIELITGHGDKPAVVGFRSVTGGLRIVDKDAAKVWAEENNLPEYITRKVVESPVADAYKEYYAETGEIPDGCEVVAKHDKFFVK